jgi:hypothetical protein
MYASRDNDSWGSDNYDDKVKGGELESERDVRMFERIEGD